MTDARARLVEPDRSSQVVELVSRVERSILNALAAPYRWNERRGRRNSPPDWLFTAEDCRTTKAGRGERNGDRERFPVEEYASSGDSQGCPRDIVVEPKL